jgi:hypothetical protein
MGYRAKLEKPGEVGDGAGLMPRDLADFDEPRRAAAAAGPADEKFETDDTGSSCFFFPLKRPPRKPSLSFFFESLSLSFLSFLEKNPPFFSFSLSFADPTVEADAPDSVRARGGRASSGLSPSCS